MPTATDELREKMRKMFGDPLDDGPPYNFLKEKGFTEKAGVLFAPRPDYMVSQEEYDCIDFLCDEWDYGWEPEAC